MTASVIHVGGDPLVKVLTEQHWTKGVYDGADGVCLHGAIRRCQPVPGDAYLIEQVESRLDRWSTNWNDSALRTEDDVLALARTGWDITDDDLATSFGPQWRAVVALVRRAAVLTRDEVDRFDAARDAAWGAAFDAAFDAARGAARGAARCAARDAALGVVTWDLATEDGPYTYTHRDLLVGPWREVIGEPADLIEVAS